MNIKKIVVSSVLVGSVLIPTAASAAYQAYVGYRLPAYSANNYTGTHTKVTDERYLQNIVENTDASGSVNFWATDENHNAISAKYAQKDNNISTKLNFTTANNKGDQVAMGMENPDWSTQIAFVSGRVDFK
ncbi:hypothetical protein [Bacillus sp. UNCCL81]|uniref:hypothetical protein n=1 Tax=Bacillus sp. UNCCL81 TaxID=1502755 RepID=UPI0008E0B3CA|nr:hypothetical protein [Bacillus sp. UNCCL81]SFC42666.1 hypothetical protein SAMN02799633_00768 [Bacillus sp. UNCCL81]